MNEKSKLAVQTPLSLFDVHMYFEQETGEFVSRVKPATGGIEGLLVFDSRPSVMLTVLADNPAQAVSVAWDKVKKEQAMPTKEAESLEAFASYVMRQVLKSME